MITERGNSLQEREMATILGASGLYRALIAVTSPVLAGLLIGQAMPYGPTTTAQVLAVMIAGLLVGLAGGLAVGSRWALVLVPLLHVMAVEIMRLDIAGPTVDAFRPDNPYGLLALIVGRGFHTVVGVLPMLLGVGLALAISRQGGENSSRVRSLIGHLPLALLAFVVVALAVLALIPARTPPIVGADGEPVPGSIASLEKVEIGGHEQALMIRAYSPDLPVLLYLSGGPGQSDLAYSRVLLADLTDDFVVVAWDQRGTGKSYSALHPAETLTLAQAVADTIELTNYLRERFDEEKIYLLGESWGSTLGVLAVQQRPDLYHAWIGSGQMVSQRETDRRLYADVLALAKETGDTDLVEQMRAYGEPPYADIPYPNATVMSQYERLAPPYTPPQAYIERGMAANLGPYGIMGSEYNLVEKTNVLRGLIDMFTVMYPQLQGIDFRQDVARLEVPVYILDGSAELSARRELALEWFEGLEAPSKRIFTFEAGGHSVVFEQFEAFDRIANEMILPETYPGY